MYPMVRGKTLSVQGDKLVSKPAVSTTIYVAGVTPAGMNWSSYFTLANLQTCTGKEKLRAN